MVSGVTGNTYAWCKISTFIPPSNGEQINNTFSPKSIYLVYRS